MKDSDRPWASPLLLVLCLTVPALCVTWAVSRPTTYTLPPHLSAGSAAASPLASSSVELSQLRQQIAMVEARELLLRETIAQQQQVTTLGLGIVTLLLTTVGLLLPVITYLTSILPGQKVVEEARELISGGLDRRFADLLARRREAEVAKAVAQLRSNDHGEQGMGGLYLGLNPDADVSEAQLVSLVDTMTGTATAAVRFQIANFVAPRHLPYITKGFIELLRTRGSEVVALLGPICRHCALASAATLRDAVKEWAAGPGSANLVHLLNNAMTSAPGFLEELINDDAWVSRLSVVYRGQSLQLLRVIAEHAGKSDVIAQSAFARSLAGRRLAAISKLMTPVALADAEYIIEYRDGLQGALLIRGSKAFIDAANELSASEKGAL